MRPGHEVAAFVRSASGVGTRQTSAIPAAAALWHRQADCRALVRCTGLGIGAFGGYVQANAPASGVIPQSRLGAERVRQV